MSTSGNDLPQPVSAEEISKPFRDLLDIIQEYKKMLRESKERESNLLQALMITREELMAAQNEIRKLKAGS